jgi:glycosyltransferase involved in cell wall biosynthesis
MSRFIAVNNDRIKLVSTSPFTTSIEVPAEYNSLSSEELITDCRFVNGSIKHKFAKKSISNMRIALVGNWKQRCGISTYAENLWGEFIKSVGEFKLFIEEVPYPTSPLNIINGKEISLDNISQCWKRGESLQKLVDEVKSFEPDIIWFQHEPGLWYNARYWISMMSQLQDYRVVATMHSIYPEHKDKTICEACVPEIVVHLDGARQALINKGVSSKIYVIAHGCEKPTKDKLWNYYHSDHTVIQAGFLFKYKGWENSLEAISLLKDKYPDIFFTGILSESSANRLDHHFYYQELMELINKFKIKENVGLIRGYQSDEVLDSYFRTNQVAIFPYVSAPGHEVYGASGIARMAMSKGIPVITSNAHHFEDLPTIKTNSTKEIADSLDSLFSSKEIRDNQINKQIDYCNNNTWEIVAKRYIDIFEGKNDF